jgi:hypothetical protein
MDGKPIFKTGIAGNQHVLCFEDRVEVAKPRASTLWISSKREVYPFGSIRDISQRGGLVTLHMGTMSVRNYSVGRGNAKKLLDAFTAFRSR